MVRIPNFWRTSPLGRGKSTATCCSLVTSVDWRQCTRLIPSTVPFSRFLSTEACAHVREMPRARCVGAPRWGSKYPMPAKTTVGLPALPAFVGTQFLLIRTRGGAPTPNPKRTDPYKLCVYGFSTWRLHSAVTGFSPRTGQKMGI